MYSYSAQNGDDIMMLTSMMVNYGAATETADSNFSLNVGYPMR